ncbi:MAG: iron chaperone [Paracoccaceae bacterium]
MTAEVEAYLTACRPDQAAALRDLRARLQALLPGHAEVMSYAMPGFRAPGPKGKMVAGYAAFAHHLGLYPHSGSVIPQIDCAPFKTSKSGILFTPVQPIPQDLLERIIRTRQAEIAAGYGKRA